MRFWTRDPVLRPLGLAALFAGFALGGAAHGWTGAAWTGQEPVEEAPSEGEPAKADEEEEVTTWFAVVGGDVHTGDGTVLRGATVLAKNGVIEEIGHNVFVPEEAEVLDATGYRVYPGLVAIAATTRLSAGGFSAEPPADSHARVFPEERDGAGVAQSVPDGWTSGIWSTDLEHAGHDHTATPQGDICNHGSPEDESGAAARPVRTAVEDSFDPFSNYLVLALATGITTARQGDAAVKLKRNELDGVDMRSDYLSSFTYSIRNPQSITKLRDDFRGAAKYLREMRAHAEEKKSNKDAEEPSKRGVDSRALAVLQGESRAKFSATERSELLGIARLAQEFGFRPVIEGCVEGWAVADELGRAGAAAIVTPRTRREKSEALVRPGGSSIENAAKLHEAGVQIAIESSSSAIDLGGITGRDLMHLPIEAGFAVRGGLSNQAALEGITIVPARLLGIDHRVGSLNVGKDCDLIVTDGDVLHYQTFVQYTVVEGKLVYDKEKELFFAHIRPRPEVPSDDAETDEQSEGETDEDVPDAPDDAESGDGDGEGDDADDDDDDAKDDDGESDA